MHTVPTDPPRRRTYDALTDLANLTVRAGALPRLVAFQLPTAAQVVAVAGLLGADVAVYANGRREVEWRGTPFGPLTALWYAYGDPAYEREPDNGDPAAQVPDGVYGEHEGAPAGRTAGGA